MGCGATEDCHHVQPKNVCDAIMSIFTKILEECFQHLVKSLAQTIKAKVLKAKRESNLILQRCT